MAFQRLRKDDRPSVRKLLCQEVVDNTQLDQDSVALPRLRAMVSG